MSEPPLLDVHDLRKEFVTETGVFSRRRTVVRAVDGVSFAAAPGETLGLVGESGCGKSTLARTILYLEEPTSGEILFEGRKLTPTDAARLRRLAQIVFQDPYTSLPPHMRVAKILADPLLIHGLAGKDAIASRVRELLRDVGLKADTADKLPYQLSGGQRQRVSIARALAVEPSLVVADEAVSALDVSVRAQILNLLRDLQADRGLTYLFISHDLSVVRYMSHRIAVMYLGEIVELGRADDVYTRPFHPYTAALISAVPSLDDDGHLRIRLEGEPPDPSNPPRGCKFYPRCPLRIERCKEERPALREVEPGRWSACHYANEVPERIRDKARARGGADVVQRAGVDDPR